MIQYVNIPEYYIFNPQQKKWVKRRRVRKNICIGRLNVVSPKDQERFYSKMILNKVKGKTSFMDLKTFNNITHNTFKETAISMGLIEHDSQLDIIFEEACSVMLPIQLRNFFAWFIMSENVQGNVIWNKYKKFFLEDSKNCDENDALLHLNKIFKTENMSCANYGLPEPKKSSINNNMDNTEINFCKDKFDTMFVLLNSDQKFIFNKIINSSKKIFFIDGPGGSGKTFLYKTLIYYLLSIKKKYYLWHGRA